MTLEDEASELTEARRSRFILHEELIMSFDTRLKYLRVALNLFGFFFLVVLAPLMLGLWPSGWTWGVDQGYSHYPLMIIAMYAVLGGFLLLAARKPQAYSAIIWYTVWSSVLHGVVMAVQAYIDPAERGHFLGDIPGLFIVAIVLGYLMPRNADFEHRKTVEPR
ncbi:MAG: hypothetical protein K0S36_988 [Nitrosospira multiformis]|jgi:hypothetical protein|nr:hypothetical protein [Nitrosospira multiformis]